MNKMTEKERMAYEQELEDGLQISKRNYKPKFVYYVTDNGIQTF